MRNIAVIVCTYINDSPCFLDEMLTSLSNAKLPVNCNLRVYLHVDGKVTGKHEDIILKYSIYKRIDSPESIGLARGLNKLINEIENEDYIFRMDSDDIVINDRFIKQIEFMDSNCEIDISGGSIKEFIGKSDCTVFERCYPKENLDDYLLKASPFAHVTVCFRKGFFGRFGDYPTEYPLNEDVAYWFKIFKGGAKASNIDTPLVLVRMDSAYSRRTFKKSFSEFKVYFLISCWKGKMPIYPFIRFLFRLFPTSIVKLVYNSKIRSVILRK